MAILETEAVQLSNAVRDAMVALRTLVNGNQLTNNLLETTDKTDLVSAVNELKASIDALSYDDLADLPTIPATVAELTDATTYDFPTLNTPVADALAAKANSADLGTIATFEGDQNLRTTDSPTFADLTASGTVTASTWAYSGNMLIESTGGRIFFKQGITTRWQVATNGDFTSTANSIETINLTASGTVTATNGLYSSVQGWNNGVGGFFQFGTGSTLLGLCSPNTDNLSPIINGSTSNGGVDLGKPTIRFRTIYSNNLDASGTVEAAAYTLGGVAQQDVSTGASPTFAGQTLTATQTVAVSGTVPVIYQGGSQAFNQFKTGATTRGYMGWTSLGGGGMCFLNASGAAATLLVSDTGNLTASGTVTLDGLARPSWTYAPVTDTSTARSLTIAADLWKRLRFSNVGAITITVPENSTQAFPIGYTIPIRRVGGAGAITIAVAGGVTVNGSAGSTSVPEGGDFALHKIATDTWDFI
jgi:hypothetical protein